MERTPFRYYIRNEIVLGTDFGMIVEYLRRIGFAVGTDHVQYEFNIMRDILPKSIKELLQKRQPIPINKENINNIEWLRKAGIFDLYYYKTIPPHRYEHRNKHLQSMEWLLSFPDIRFQINRLLFNREPIEKIAVFISSKYKADISAKAVKFYEHYMWNIEGMTAKHCFQFDRKFRTDALITINGEIAKLDDAADPGITDALASDDLYFKWKAGEKVELEDMNTILRQVSADFFFKMKEAMHATKIIETEHEAGTGFEGQPFSNTKTKISNIQKESAKITKSYLDMFLRTQKAIKVDDSNVSSDFFNRIEQLSLVFEEEKIASYKDVFADVKDDVK